MFEATSVARFGGGAYWIRSDLDGPEHAIASVHEELHGIVRRSTPYGHLLRHLDAAARANPRSVAATALYILGGRARTSEEVFATYGSLRKAAGGPLTSAAAARLIGVAPTYGIYQAIGAELVGAEPSHVAATAVLDAIIRFCWSSNDLPTLRVAVDDPSIVLRLPAHAYPDERLNRVRRLWSPASTADLVGMISQEARVLLDRNVDDDLQRALGVQAGHVHVVAPDVAAYVDRARVQLLQQQAAIEEQVVLRLYEVLCDRYEETPLAGMRPTQFAAYRDVPAPAGQPLQPTAHALPEVVELRTERRRLLVAADAPCDRKSALFIRSGEQFIDQFDLAGLEQSAFGELVAYRGCVETFRAATEDEPLPIDALWTGAVPPPDVMRHLIRPDELIAIWASAFLQRGDLARALRYRTKGYWLVCDVLPTTLLRATRELIPELWGQWMAPTRARPNVGALVAIQVGESGPVDGIVFPGSRMTVGSPVVSDLRRELGDDLRGIGPGPTFGRQHGQFTEGAFITEWLVKTEYTFCFRDGRARAV